MAATGFILKDGIPGVFEARQNRSVKNRDGFIRAGIEALNTKSFDELKISDLAAASGNSVGSFYTRFQDKDAYFRALRVYSVDAIEREIEADFTQAALREMSSGEALDSLVDLLGAIFSSRFRGVLRESYPRILDADDPWAPMRTQAQKVLKTLHDGLEEAFPHYTPTETKTKLSFCFQMITGVLQNDLVNNYHVFTLKDGTILDGLKEALRAYMGVPREGFEHGE